MNALSLPPASGPAAAPGRAVEGTRRLRQLPRELFGDDGLDDELTDAQVDAMLMPPPLPLPHEAPRASAGAVRWAGLRWGIAFSFLVWFGIVAWMLTT